MKSILVDIKGFKTTIPVVDELYDAIYAKGLEAGKKEAIKETIQYANETGVFIVECGQDRENEERRFVMHFNDWLLSNEREIECAKD